MVISITTSATKSPRLPHLARLACSGVAFLGTSCVSLVTSEQAAIQPHGKVASPVAVTVVDQRTNTSGGFRKNRYYGRCRLSYGIPSPILDPKMPVATRVSQQLAAGFQQRGSTVVIGGSEGGTATKTLAIRLDDVWIDFANPLTGNESILYFDATAEVRDRSGKVVASASRKRESDFRYDVNDSLFNQAVKTLQPEFTALINEPSIQASLAR